MSFLAYRPLMDPLPYAWEYWWLLLFPLVIGVSIVYKSIKCSTMKQVPRESAVIATWILAGLVAAGASLVVIVKLIDYTRR